MSNPAPDGRVYAGRRNPGVVGPAMVVRHDPPALPELLDPRYDLRCHSPDGFQWGYGGSGPAQLALAMVADATGDDELAFRTYQRFKAEILATLQEDSWTIAALMVRDFARSLDAPKEPNWLPNYQAPTKGERDADLSDGT